MKAVILAGGLGTRLSEETELRPKPMVEIGGKPILWHIMKGFSSHGINDFIVCCGYKGYVIKEYFANYFLHTADVCFDMSDHSTTVLNQTTEPWRVTLIDTGATTLTGGRLLRIQKYLNNGEPFCFTYGDGVSDVNVDRLVEIHKSRGLLATVTAVNPPGRYGALKVDSSGNVIEFAEKPIGGGGLINGGFFVLEPEVLKYIDGDNISFENEPVSHLVIDKQLGIFPHHGFWHPMDTLRDKNHLNRLWENGAAPWKTWDM